MPAPHEIVAAPLVIYLAVIGTAFPLIDDLPADFDAAWEVLGTEGSKNYDDSGVSVSQSEEVSDFKPAGSTFPSKRFRTGESNLIKVNLVDIGAAAYAKVMNDAQITTVAFGSGVAGEQSFSLIRGDQVASFAVLLRGMSPADNDLNQQFEISKAFVSVNGDSVYKKGDPVMLPVEIEPIVHSDTDVILNRIQTHVAS
jgi:hypothetical protein